MYDLKEDIKEAMHHTKILKIEQTDEHTVMYVRDHQLIGAGDIHRLQKKNIIVKAIEHTDDPDIREDVVKVWFERVDLSIA